MSADNLPAGWAVTSISEITTSIGGGTPPTSDASFWEGGSTPWVSPKDMKVFRLRRAIDSVTERALERLTVVPSSSVLVVVRSGILAHSLPVAINDRSVVLNQDMRAFVPQTGVNAAFVAWQLVAYEGEILERCTKDGTTVASIEASRLAAFALKLAPAAEQIRVVEAIESLLSGLDAAIRDLGTAKRKLALYRQSLLKSAVEGVLTAGWHGHVAEVDTIGPAASSEGWAAIPKGWRWSMAASESGFITKGTTPPKSLTSEGAKCVPFLRVTNLTHDGSLNLSDQVFVAEDIHRKFLARSIVKPGDVLMNIVGPPLGQVSMVPSTFSEWNVNQAIAIFRTLPGLLNEFLAYVLLSPGAIRWLQARAKTTAGQTNLTLEVCRALPVPVPPLAEQAEIVRLLNQQLEALTEQGNAIDRAIVMASAQRRNILRVAFSGQLVPQNPNDEPASVLLERIRAQRSTAGGNPAARRPRKAKIAA